MQSISNLATGVSKAVWGEGKPEQQSGEEPPSGETGKGTTAEPFDAGNAPEQDEANKSSTAASTETPTTSTATSMETPTTSAPTADKPQNANARMPSFTAKLSAPGDEPKSMTTDQYSSSGNPLEEPSSTAAVKDDTDPNEVTPKPAAPSGNAVFDAKDPGAAAEASRARNLARPASSPERSVSPGARPDGSHAETGKEEKSKFSSKLKSKLHIGGKH